MNSQPRGDSASADPRWERALAHRFIGAAASDSADIIARFTECEVEPHQVEAALSDGGDALFAAAASGAPDWADAFGGPLAAALLTAEVSALAAHLNSRASAVRSMAVERLLDEYSAVTVAAELGVSRQKVYEIARGGSRPSYIDKSPWRRS